MKNAIDEPEHLRDALASLPEPLDLQDLILSHNRRREQGDFLKQPPETSNPVNDPLSHSRLR